MALAPAYDEPRQRASTMATIIEPEGTGRIVKRKRRPARQQVKPGQIAKVRRGAVGRRRAHIARRSRSSRRVRLVRARRANQTGADFVQTTSGALRAVTELRRFVAGITRCAWMRLLSVRAPVSGSARSDEDAFQS